jgi:hypothetical protein
VERAHASLVETQFVTAMKNGKKPHFLHSKYVVSIHGIVLLEVGPSCVFLLT